jgi:hypothetical protein
MESQVLGKEQGFCLFGGMVQTICSDILKGEEKSR